MADRMAVMLDGVVQQLGSAEELYARPANRSVAGFIGSPAMNVLRGQVFSDNGQTSVIGDAWQLPLSGQAAAKARASRDGAVDVGIRHGHLRLVPEATPGAVPGRIYTVEPTGDVI